MKYIFAIYFLFNTLLIYAGSKYPADISYLVADLKYNDTQGVKICEIQQGIISTVKGDQFSYGEDGNIDPHFYQTLSQFPAPFWATKLNISRDKIQKMGIKQEWNVIFNLSELISDPKFCLDAKKALKDPYDISSYHGFVYLKQSEFKDLDAFRLEFPGMLVLDAATRNYWVDKYKMSLLFNTNPALIKFKPRWNAYPKKYSEDLSSKIINDLNTDRFVIKPKNQFKGAGVIIVDAKDLNRTLKSILSKPSTLTHNSEDCYSYWRYDQSDSFIVEEFVLSDPVYVEHLNGFYEPTIRVAFFLIYNHKKIHVEYCGGYLRLPTKSIDENGTLSEKYKDATVVPYFDKIDPETYEKVKAELSIALPLLYEQMLMN